MFTAFDTPTVNRTCTSELGQVKSFSTRSNAHLETVRSILGVNRLWSLIWAFMVAEKRHGSTKGPATKRRWEPSCNLHSVAPSSVKRDKQKNNCCTVAPTSSWAEPISLTESTALWPGRWLHMTSKQPMVCPMFPYENRQLGMQHPRSPSCATADQADHLHHHQVAHGDLEEENVPRWKTGLLGSTCFNPYESAWSSPNTCGSNMTLWENCQLDCNLSVA